VLLNEGDCGSGGIIGEIVTLDASISVENGDPATTLMRHKTASSCLTEEELSGELWQPYLSSIEIPFEAISGWVGVYLSVQLQDDKGRMSNVLCDDISVEGMPQELDESKQEIAPLTFENNLDVPICIIRVTVNPISQEINLATLGDPLFAGEVREIPVNVGNNVDVEIRDCNDQIVETISGLEIKDNGVYYFLSPSTGRGADDPNLVYIPRADIQFVSNVDVPICQIDLVSPEQNLDIVIATESNPILPGETRSQQIYVGEEFSFIVADCDGFILDSIDAMVMPEEGVVWYLSPSTGRGAD
jgi:hypothetical protein